MLCDHLHCLPSQLKNYNITMKDIMFLSAWEAEKARQAKEYMEGNKPRISRIPRI